MSVLLRVGVVPGRITAALAARVRANLERNRRQQEERTARERARAEQEEQRKKRGRRRSQGPLEGYRPDEPVGSPQPAFLPAYGFWREDFDTQTQAMAATIFSGSLQQSATFQADRLFPSNPPSGTNYWLHPSFGFTFFGGQEVMRVEFTDPQFEDFVFPEEAFYQAFAPGGPNNLYSSGQFINQFYQYRNEVRAITLALPIDKDRQIIAFWQRAVRRNAFNEQAIESYVYSYNITFFTETWAANDITGPYYRGQFAPGSYTVTYGNLGPSTIHETYPAVNRFVDESTDELVTTQCALVTGGSVRLLDMPQALADLLAQVHPTPTWQPAGQVGVWGDWQWGGPDVGNLNLLALRLDASSEALPVPAHAANDAGIYKVVRNIATYTDGGQSALEAFLQTELPPAVKLSACQLGGTCTASLIGFDFTRAPNDAQPLYRRNQRGDRPVAGYDDFHRLLASWNWGALPYCENQLLQLGFQAADLIP